MKMIFLLNFDEIVIRAIEFLKLGLYASLDYFSLYIILPLLFNSTLYSLTGRFILLFLLIFVVTVNCLFKAISGNSNRTQSFWPGKAFTLNRQDKSGCSGVKDRPEACEGIAPGLRADGRLGFVLRT